MSDPKAPPGPVPLVPGQVVLGLEIRRLCGVGGFGSVYEAFDPVLRRPVALKVLHRWDAARLRRFRDEGRSLARLTHPRIVQVFGVDALPDGSPVLIMQYVPGGALADHLTYGVPLPVETAAEIMADVLDALAAAHAAGVCHRDVKPANVLWHPGARAAWLCDFGIARLVDAPPTEPTAGLVGSRQSLAPERLRGVADDPRSDLFAAGAMLHRLVSGVDAFEAAGGDLIALAESMKRPPAPPPHVPAGLARLCAALMAYEPAHRPSAADARLMLRAALRLSDTEDAPRVAASPSSSSPAAAPTSSSASPRAAGLLATGAVVIVLVTVWAFAGRTRPESPGPVSDPASTPPLPSVGDAPAVAGTVSVAVEPAAATRSAPPSEPATPASAAPASLAPRPRAPADGRYDRRPRNPTALEQPWVEPSP
ncbi:protein kinase [Myxococcota bacterium]|nr:protein kinase [Myxococcota bacterium]